MKKLLGIALMSLFMLTSCVVEVNNGLGCYDFTEVATYTYWSPTHAFTEEYIDSWRECDLFESEAREYAIDNTYTEYWYDQYYRGYRYDIVTISKTVTYRRR